MIEGILSSIICDEYQKQFRDKGNYRHAMKLEFALYLDYAKEDGHRNVELWLYAEDNYVGVYSRENWTVRNSSDYNAKYNKDTGEWKHLAFHDSCWRSDGVDSFIKRNRDRLNCLRGFHGWYKRVEVTPEQVKVFREVTKKHRSR